MKTIKSCEFNIDTACVEVKYPDGSMLAVDALLFLTTRKRVVVSLVPFRILFP